MYMIQRYMVHFHEPVTAELVRISARNFYFNQNYDGACRNLPSKHEILEG